MYLCRTGHSKYFNYDDFRYKLTKSLLTPISVEDIEAKSKCCYVKRS